MFAKALLVAILVTAAPAHAGQGVGNGGDYLQMLFEQGRAQAVAVLDRWQPNRLPVFMATVLKPGDREWLSANAALLAADIAATEHAWADVLPAGMCPNHTCACTTSEPRAKVHLSFDSCRQQVSARAHAGQVLVHESLHHLLGPDEAQATRLSAAVYAMWMNQGHPESPHWNAICLERAHAAENMRGVWTGSELMVWGGWSHDGAADPRVKGSLYSPRTDLWRETATEGEPQARFGHTVIWSGNDAIVWGGQGHATNTLLADGAAYNPVSNVWRALPPSPLVARNGHGAVWARDRMIVFGGKAETGSATDQRLADGAAYLPAKGQWQMLPVVGAPSPRTNPALEWTGTKVLVWGGYAAGDEFVADGALYDPVSNLWTNLPNVALPHDIGNWVHVWTGEHFIVFGSDKSGEPFGFALELAKGTWRGLDLHGAPSGGHHAVAAWTGVQMVVWSDGGVPYYDGVRSLQRPEAFRTSLYDIIHDRWERPKSFAPPALADGVAAWTGAEMLLWGVDRSGQAMGGAFQP